MRKASPRRYRIALVLRKLSGRTGRTRSAPHPSLRLRYDAVALRWQEMLSGLGYPEAYAVLAREHGARTAQLACRCRRVLDVGTGTGALAAAVSDVQGRLLALDLLDISPSMLAIAKRRLETSAACVKTLPSAIGQTCLAAQSYDAVLCAHALEHLDDPEEGIVWMRDLLHPGGQLVLAVSKPHWCTALIRWRWGNRAYSSAEVVAMLKRQGFADVRVVPFQSGPPSRTSCGYIASAPADEAGIAA
jgi:2-polyprenyl-3-methyl-5-hydroxy-6-metoxy-1,4-benzoquinol methylase